MLAGILCAGLVPPLLEAPLAAYDITPAIVPLFAFPVILVITAIICVVVSLKTPAEDTELLKRFYKQVNPWGFWGPIREAVVAENATFEANPAFKRDMFNIFIGVIAQTCLVALPIFIVVKEWDSTLTTM